MNLTLRELSAARAALAAALAGKYPSDAMDTRAVAAVCEKFASEIARREGEHDRQKAARAAACKGCGQPPEKGHRFGCSIYGARQVVLQATKTKDGFKVK